VLSHLLLYSQGLMTRPEGGLHSPRLLFSATLADKTPADAPDSAPSLGTLLLLLRHHSQLLADSCRQLELLQRQLDGAHQLDGQLLAELAGDDQLPLDQRRQRAHSYLSQQRGLVTQQVELGRHVLELALHLLWTHLDAYLVRGLSVTAAAGSSSLTADWIRIDDSMTGGGVGDVAGVLSAQTLSQLKRELPQSVPDSLLKQVETALHHPLVGSSHYSFSEAMVRRIRRVTRLHTAA